MSSSEGNRDGSPSFGGVSNSVEADLLGVRDEGLDDGLDDGLEVVVDDSLEEGLEVGLDEGLDK